MKPHALPEVRKPGGVEAGGAHAVAAVRTRSGFRRDRGRLVARRGTPPEDGRRGAAAWAFTPRPATPSWWPPTPRRWGFLLEPAGTLLQGARGLPSQTPPGPTCAHGRLLREHRTPPSRPPGPGVPLTLCSVAVPCLSLHFPASKCSMSLARTHTAAPGGGGDCRPQVRRVRKITPIS